MPLPVRIDATRSILKICKELTGTCNLGAIITVNTEVCRYALSMCITRIVNQVCDLNQDGKFAKSVANTAKNISMPDFLVDLRHDSTHGSLPQLYILARGLDYLFIWLVDNYWQKQYEAYKSKEDKILAQVDKFERRSRVATDNYALAQFAEATFVNDLSHFRGKIAHMVAEFRIKMKEDAWAILFLQLQNRILKFPEAVLQSSFKLLKKGKLALSQMKIIVEDVLELAHSVNLSITPWVKHLLIQQNTEIAAFDILNLLIEKNAFAEALIPALTQISSVSRIGKQAVVGELKIERLPDVPRWRKIHTWSNRILGSNSVLDDLNN